MLHRLTLPLVLLFLGGCLVGISAGIHRTSPYWSTGLFYAGYAIDAVAVLLFFFIWFQKR